MSGANQTFETARFETADRLIAAIAPVARMNTRTPNPDFIFRGHGDSTWLLVPTAQRIVKKTGRSTTLSLIRTLEATPDAQVWSEFVLLEDFLKACDRSGIAVPGDDHGFRTTWMNRERPSFEAALKNPSVWPSQEYYSPIAFARHHGIPTRLLDWSRSGMIAAYFAAKDAIKYEIDGYLAIWALNIEFLHSYGDVELISMPGANSHRLGAQRGLFTLVRDVRLDRSPATVSGDLAAVLVSKNIDPTKPKPLWKLTLPTTEATRLLYLCHLYGVDAASMFPGPEGAADAVLESTNWWAVDPATGHSAVTVRSVSELNIEGERAD